MDGDIVAYGIHSVEHTALVDTTFESEAAVDIGMGLPHFVEEVHSVEHRLLAVDIVVRVDLRRPEEDGHIALIAQLAVDLGVAPVLLALRQEGRDILAVFQTEAQEDTQQHRNHEQQRRHPTMGAEIVVYGKDDFSHYAMGDYFFLSNIEG